MRDAITELADGLWWEPIVDLATNVKVRVNEDTGDLLLVDIYSSVWKKGLCLPLEHLDYSTAQLEMSFHGFGGGSARTTELVEPSMFHCVYSNDTIYHFLTSLKGLTYASRRKKCKQVERKLPPIISRYVLLFRSLIQINGSIFSDEESQSLIFPRRVNRSDFGPSHVIRDLFNSSSLPDMTQVRQFWACVSNFVTGGEQQHKCLSSTTIGASKKGHSTFTHASTYSSERVGSEEVSEFFSLANLRSAKQLRYPTSSTPEGHNYLSLQQKELVEFGNGAGLSEKQHCLGLLAHGDGKLDSYTHFSLQFLKRLGLESSISILCFTARDIYDLSPR